MLTVPSAVPRSKTVCYLWALLPMCFYQTIHAFNYFKNVLAPEMTDPGPRNTVAFTVDIDDVLNESKTATPPGRLKTYKYI